MNKSEYDKKLGLTLAKKIGKGFRNSLIQENLSNAPGNLSYFPDGCCNWASYFIGHYLKYEMSLNPIEIIGCRPGSDGEDEHSWVVVDDIIIDITSDQFSDSIEPIIIGYTSAWHETWQVIQRNPIHRIETKDFVSLGNKLSASAVYRLVIRRALGGIEKKLA